MGRNKLQKFKANQLSTNVIEPGKPSYDRIKGRWHDHFSNNNPLVAELACGYGEYTTGLATEYPEKNFIGVDIKGARIWKGSQIANTHNLQNVAFLRTQIQQLGDFFAENELSEIWITFPDPRPRSSDEHKRLTHHKMLMMYKKLLSHQGVLHLKTDSEQLFDFSLSEIPQISHVENLEYTYDLYQSELLDEHRGITTRYEKLFLQQNKKIKYLRFRVTKPESE